jgi:hypothetical protein
MNSVIFPVFKFSFLGLRVGQLEEHGSCDIQERSINKDDGSVIFLTSSVFPLLIFGRGVVG